MNDPPKNEDRELIDMIRQRGETEYGEINDNSVSALCFAIIAKMIMIY